MSDFQSLRERFAPEISDFRDFLDEVKPPFFVAQSLATLLAAHPSAPVGPEVVAWLVAEWAAERAESTERRVGDFLVSATEMIVDADRVGAVADFSPGSFYGPFRAALLRACPEDQRGALDAAFSSLDTSNQSDAQGGSTADFAVENGEVFRGERMTREDSFAASLSAILEEASLSDDGFNEAFGIVRRALTDESSVPPIQQIAATQEAATALFNRGALGRSAALFSILDESWRDPRIAPARSKDARGTAKRRLLDDMILSRWTNDPKRRTELAPVIRFFSDFAPNTLLSSLAEERTPGRANQLVGLLEAHGADVVPAVVKYLSSPDLLSKGPTLALSLLTLLSRVQVQADSDKRDAAHLAAKFVTNENPQIRAAAIQVLRQVGGRATMPAVLNALESNAYRQTVFEQSDDLKAHLGQLLELLLATGIESATIAVVEFATGVRDGGFKSLGRSLRELALGALAKSEQPLPRRATLLLAESLRSMAGKKLVIITGALTLGVDAELCLRMIRILYHSPEPEVRAVMEMPNVRKLIARAQMIG